MTHEEREICLDIAKNLKKQLFPLPSETGAKAQDEFIRKVCYATWSSIGHLAKNSLINSGLTFCKEYDFEQEWMKQSDILYTYIKNQARDEYEKAMRDCVARRFKFNGQSGQVIFHSNLSLLDAIQEIHNIANEIKEMD